LLCGAATAQVPYFNNGYDHPIQGNITSTNIVIHDDLIVVPGVYLNDGGVGYDICTFNLDGENPEWTTVLDSSQYIIYMNYSDACFENSNGNIVHSTRLDGIASLLEYDIESEVVGITNNSEMDSYETAIQLESGGYVAASIDNSSDSVRIDWYTQNFEFLNGVTFNPFSWNVFYRVSRLIELQNGDILLSGYALDETNELNYDANQYVCRMSSSGEILWVSTFDFDYMDWTIYPVEEADGEITAFFGHVNWVEDPDGYREYFYGQIGTMEINPLNGDSSNVILYDQELHYYWISDFQHTPDGGYIGAGRYIDLEASYPNVSFIIKFDENREVDWFKKIEYNSDLGWEGQISYLMDIEVLPDSSIVGGGYWISGTSAGAFPWVFRTDACGDLMWNNCVVTSYTEIDKQNFTVYPNPFTDHLIIEIPIQSDELEVRDLSGKLVLQQKTFSAQQLTLNLSTIPAGAYILMINTSEGKMSKAILK
jgi:hypothetical protein